MSAERMSVHTIRALGNGWDRVWSNCPLLLQCI